MDTSSDEAAVTDIQGVFTHIESVSGLSRFWLEFYDALAARADGLFELVDALLGR